VENVKEVFLLADYGIRWNVVSSTQQGCQEMKVMYIRV